MVRFDARIPYDDLPSLPPAADIETKPVLRRCAAARAALAALDQASQLIPNPAMLINTLPLLEARDSSEIENIVTTADKLFQYAQTNDRRADAETKEALRYRTALREGFEALKQRPLTTATAVKVCSTIKAVEMEVRKVPGTTISNRLTGEVIYTPPEGRTLLDNKLANWERFLNERSELDPLIRMAVGHYQFEAIHPFTDGNGRTGRVLNILFLVDQGLLTLPILYLSRHIIHSRSDYYRLLRAVTTEDAWESWVLYMLEAVESTSGWTRGKILAINRLMNDTIEQVRAEAERVYSRELVEVIFTQPYCRIDDVVRASIAKRQTASEYLKKLCAIGILEERAVGRDKLFVNTRLARLLMEETAEGH